MKVAKNCVSGMPVWRLAMSVGIIHDNMVKTSLVQQTQTRGDDVQRSLEIGQVAAQREDNRQRDQVVIQTKQKEEHGIRPDAEREKEGRKKRREEEEEEQQEMREREEQAKDAPEQYQRDGKTSTRAYMRKINIVV